MREHIGYLAYFRTRVPVSTVKSNPSDLQVQQASAALSFEARIGCSALRKANLPLIPLIAMGYAIAETCKKREDRNEYISRHMLEGVMTDLSGFEAFFKGRRQRLLERIAVVLNGPDKLPHSVPEDPDKTPVMSEKT